MTKIIIRFPYTDDEFNYVAMISDVEKFLHKKLDKENWKFEIYREEDVETDIQEVKSI
jgi:hypothetical protein